MAFLPGMANYKDFPLTAVERANRSVFVGNIPYEATEEQLKDIFAQVGPVISFRLVYDRETGKPKGYGFCEYQDIETAKSAMRNLNNHDFNGRPLRVGVAAGEQAKDENKSMQQALGGPPVESPFGDPTEPEKAPEAISKAVASLPPEQMFELMKQMKLCIQNNPNEARNMLLQNPQLAYALLQAQIVMKIVDPQVALAMLHRQTEQIPPLVPTETPQEQQPMDMDIRDQRQPGPGPQMGGPSGPPRPMGGQQGGGPPSMGPPTAMGGPNRGPGPMGGQPTSAAVPPGSSAPAMGGPPQGLMQPSSIGGPMQGNSQTMMSTQGNMGQRHGPPDFGPGGPGDRGGRGGLLGDHPPQQGAPRMSNRLEGLPQGDSDLRGPRPEMGGPGMRPQGPPQHQGPGHHQGPQGHHQGPPGHHSGQHQGPPSQHQGPPGQHQGPPGQHQGPPGQHQGPPGQHQGQRHPGPPGPGRGGPGHDFGGPGGPGRGGPDRGPDRGGPDMGSMDTRGPGARPESRDPRQAEPRRNPQGPGSMGGPPARPQGPGPAGPAGAGPAGAGPAGAGPTGAGPTGAGGPDQEKAALIMQVLQLSDEQIALLPPDQRQSILILKDQIARSAL